MKKLGAKGDIGFFIGYSADSCAYRVYNRRTKKIMETLNVTFDELSAMAFEQSSSKSGLQGMTSKQISSGLDLTYAPSTITTQQPTEAALRTVLAAQAPQVLQTPTATTTSQDVDELETQQHVNLSPLDLIIQSNYVLEILNKYGMETCDPVGTPMEIKDKLDLDQNGTLLSQRKHPHGVKRIFRYLPGTVNTCLWYSKDLVLNTGFSDADYAGCKDTFKSTSGGAQFLGEKLVSWSSKKQDCTALSTAEAEYVSLSVCLCAKSFGCGQQLTDYGFHFNKIPIYYDSKSSIAISCNMVQHSRTKHIVVRYHFIKEHMEKGMIETVILQRRFTKPTSSTKALPGDRFNYLVRRL
ncbi:copia protein, partial [Tanacetum coccineum]